MTPTQSLIAKMSDATEGSRELDAEIWLSVTPHEIRDYDGTTTLKNRYVEVAGEWFCWLDNLREKVPACTTSLDAAVSLIPEGWAWDITSSGDACLTLPGNGFLSDRGDAEKWGDGKTPTPTLAICIAALRAREVNTDD
jgi:hypothetical protein